MWRIVRVWILLGIILAVTLQLSFDHLWIAALVPVAFWGAGGLALLGVSLWQMREPENRGSLWRVREPPSRRPILCRSFAIGASLLVFVPLAQVGASTLKWARLYWMQSEYARIARRLEADPPPAAIRSEEAGVHYVVDPGPPVRVAFPWPGGITDNWCGVVHDPSGEVLGVNALSLESSSWRSSPLTKLFGGDMTSCRAVGTSFYLCCFT